MLRFIFSLALLTLVSTVQAASTVKTSTYSIGICNPIAHGDCETITVNETERECLDEQYDLIEENEDSYTEAEIIQQTKDVPSLCDIKVNN